MTQALRRPPAPGPAERARTIATRGGRAAVLPSSDEGSRVVPLLHHVHGNGVATLLLPDEDPLVAAAWQAPRRPRAPARPRPLRAAAARGSRGLRPRRADRLRQSGDHAEGTGRRAAAAAGLPVHVAGPLRLTHLIAGSVRAVQSIEPAERR